MNRPAYSGAYSQRRFSNYTTADNAPSSGSASGRLNLSVSSGEPTMGEVSVLQLTAESPLQSESAVQQNTPASRGAAASGHTYRATAKAFEGYRFIQWQTNLDGVGNTSRNPLEFKLTKDTWLVARFEKLPTSQQQTRTANVSWDGKMGRVSGNGLVLDDSGRANSGVLSATQGSSVTLTASPLAGYHFVKWHGAPIEGKTSAEITFQMNNNYTIGAEFAADEPGTGTGEGGGNVIGGGGGGGSITDTPQPITESTVAKKETGVKAFVKKWWWAILIVAYVVYKERKGGSK